MIESLSFKILRLDLSNWTATTITMPADDTLLYLGGRGLAAKLLFEGQKEGVDPLGPENQLIFSTGKFVGTPVPTAGQLTISAKSPATNFYCKSNTGGIWAKALRRAGWDCVVVTGVSRAPVFVSIDDEEINFHDATSMWGDTVREGHRKAIAILGGEGWDTAAIGQAGENLVNFACVMTSLYHAAGRGGMGAVMGAKKLKLIAVRGSHNIPVANPTMLQDEIQKVLAKAHKSVKAGLLLEYGTTATIELANEGGSLPVQNFASAQLPGGHKLGGSYLVEQGYMHQGSACSVCPMGCHKHTIIEEGPYRGHSGGPEYETLAALGSSCNVTDTEAVLKGNELCNDYGLDTISTGGVISWLMECVENGVISQEDCDVPDVRWGSGEAMVELIHRITQREGIGDLLAKGTKQASEEIGGDSWKWAVQANGLEQSRVDTRVAKAYALSFAVNPRGPDHLYAQPQAEFGRSPEAKRLVKELMGSEKYCDSTITEGKPELVRWHEDMFAVTDCLGICSFATTTTYIIDAVSIASFLEAVLDVRMSKEEVMEVGRRTVVLERCFNLRENPDRRDILPWRIMNDPVARGPRKGHMNSEAELKDLLASYYKLQDYDPLNGRPTKRVLEYLKLLDNVKGLAELMEKYG
ncbi:aldehyde ferredoxin oxidoreductase family protein [Desulfoferula mesophila]|uniref:Aldehyde ferredoxin oxidoreductase n=1 Tax=Desulfoferula mesophila TaxID=3058419 RepID=A0AAU9EIM1_9BACT|nr:aldehyde ferredoxin oxidoreductase [Desulfoferula mesophilus]